MGSARLNMYCHKPPEASATAPVYTDEEQAEWIKRMQDVLSHAATGPFKAELETDTGTLHLDAERHGTAYVAAWNAGTPPKTVAATVFLRGKDGAEDAAAMAEFRKMMEPV